MRIIPLQLSPQVTTEKIRIILKQLNYPIHDNPDKFLNHVYLFVLEGRSELRFILPLLTSNCKCNLFIAFRSKISGIGGLYNSIKIILESLKNTLYNQIGEEIKKIVIFYVDQEDKKIDEIKNDFEKAIESALYAEKVELSYIDLNTSRLIGLKDKNKNIEFYLLLNGTDICNDKINHSLEENLLKIAIDLKIKDPKDIPKCCSSIDKLKQCTNNLLDDEKLINMLKSNKHGIEQFTKLREITDNYC